MKIIISNRLDLPIYAQIEEQIKEQILNGDLAEGTVLPSIRKLASETGVSVITTTRAYSDLAEEGFIGTIPGKGTIVLAQDNDLLKERCYLKIEEGLKTAVDTAKKAGMSEEEIRSLLHVMWEEE